MKSPRNDRACLKPSCGKWKPPEPIWLPQVGVLSKMKKWWWCREISWSMSVMLHLLLYNVCCTGNMFFSIKMGKPFESTHLTILLVKHSCNWIDESCFIEVAHSCTWMSVCPCTRSFVEYLLTDQSCHLYIVSS